MNVSRIHILILGTYKYTLIRFIWTKTNLLKKLMVCKLDKNILTDSFKKRFLIVTDILLPENVSFPDQAKFKAVPNLLTTFRACK